MEIMLSTDAIVEKYLSAALENPDTPFTYNDVMFLNIKRLYDFVVENSKADFIDFEETVKQVIENAGNGGSFELRTWETKSGNTEVLDFDYETEIDEETGDVIRATIRFR